MKAKDHTFHLHSFSFPCSLSLCLSATELFLSLAFCENAKLPSATLQ